eukprot:10242004-Lingulodinium_polyedra.AAC.1
MLLRDSKHAHAKWAAVWTAGDNWSAYAANKTMPAPSPFALTKPLPGQPLPPLVSGPNEMPGGALGAT